MPEIKTKDFTCVKDIGGEGEMVTCSYRKKSSEIFIHPNNIMLANVKCKNIHSKMVECSLEKATPFVPGKKWSDSFDYCGMLDAGQHAKLSDGKNKLNRLFNSFEDVNYHAECEPLWDAINLMDEKKMVQAQAKIKKFNELCKKSKEKMC